MAHLKLGEILLQQGLINEDQLRESIQVQKRESGRIGEILIKMGFLTEEDIVAAAPRNGIFAAAAVNHVVAAAGVDRVDARSGNGDKIVAAAAPNLVIAVAGGDVDLRSRSHVVVGTNRPAPEVK